MDVLVAGGTGFIGQSLCRVLLDRGHDVTAFGIEESALRTIPDYLGA